MIAETTSPLAIIVLAAGTSSRMGEANKLLTSLHGSSLISHALRACQESKSGAIYTITGYQASAITELAARYEAQALYHEAYDKGLGTSLAFALTQLAEHYDNLMVMLGDMPYITSDIITKIAQAHLALPTPEAHITRPSFDGRHGHPVIWGRAHFAKLATLSGDSGGQALIDKQALHIVPITLAEAQQHPLKDFDMPADFNQADCE